MTRISHGLLAAAALLCSVPAFAQAPASPSVPSGAHGGHGHGRHAMRACMMERLPGLKAEAEAHMQQFRASHPNASREERHADRRAFMQAERQAHGPEIRAARAACRGAG